MAFQRSHLERLLGLDRFKQTRVDWLTEDLKEFFPHVEIYWLTGKKKSLGSVIAARVPFKDALPKGSMTIQERIQGVSESGPRLGVFELWKIPSAQKETKVFEGVVPFFADSANYNERFLSAYLSLLAQGQISPHSLPPLKPGENDDTV